MIELLSFKVSSDKLEEFEKVHDIICEKLLRIGNILTNKELYSSIIRGGNNDASATYSISIDRRELPKKYNTQKPIKWLINQIRKQGE